MAIKNKYEFGDLEKSIDSSAILKPRRGNIEKAKQLQGIHRLENGELFTLLNDDGSINDIILGDGKKDFDDINLPLTSIRTRIDETEKELEEEQKVLSHKLYEFSIKMDETIKRSERRSRRATEIAIFSLVVNIIYIIFVLGGIL